MTEANTPTPPIATKKAHTITTHNHTRTDPYYWLREKSNPEVIAHLEAENAYTKSMMAHTEGLQDQLYKEMVGRIQETDQSAPVKIDDFFYYHRTVEGQQYPIYCRKRGNMENEEEVLLDLNALAEGEEYLKLGIFKVSPDHSLLAYSLDTDGYENFDILFKNLTTGELLPDHIPNTAYHGEWANDNQIFFYTTQDQAKRSYRLHRHSLGTSPDEDVLLFQEDNELFRVRVARSKDRSYLFLNTESIETTEIHFLDANQPEEAFRIISARETGHQYSVAHHAVSFYIATNKDAKNFKVVTTPVSQPGMENWREIVPHSEEVKIDSVELLADHMVLHKRENGLTTMGVTDLRTQESHEVVFPEPAYTYLSEENPVFDTDQVRFVYMSLTTPDTTYDYEMNKREMKLVKRKPVLGGFEPDNYTSERLFAAAADGRQIPISLVYHKDHFKQDRSNPCLLYGYGSYGYSMEPYFFINMFSLIDRGFVFAIAHIRGGQEMGRYWYDEGKFLNKKNTFTDFIACGEHIVAKNYTSKEKLGIMGRSAGGLLVGAALNMAPDLFNAAVAGVPFVDVVTTMLDESIPLTVGEFEEWGNPKDKDYYDYMLSYSPYDNVDAKDYPNILITAGLNDPRVHYWEPAKWVAKLRAHKTDENNLLLKTNMGAGHGGASGRYDYLKEIAFEYAFLIDILIERNKKM